MDPTGYTDFKLIISPLVNAVGHPWFLFNIS